VLIGLVVAVNLAFILFAPSVKPTSVTLPYSPDFLRQVRVGNVVSITTTDRSVRGDLRRAIRFPTAKAHPVTHFTTQVPEFADEAKLTATLVAAGVRVRAKKPAGSSILTSLLVSLLPLLLIVGVFMFIARRAGGRSPLNTMGRSRARQVTPSETRVTFDDVAGIDEVKEELVEIVDFLQHPDRYRRLGGRIPHGVLLTGPPGTGKTLLARALAGEAAVPFFQVSASEFVEMYVGVGAARVRDLFAEARKVAPSIIFIDELDAIGRARSGVASGPGSNDEREQTLNQILTELDGFDPSVSVIVLSATNRPEILDKALLRPGRFDRRVAVQPPDLAGRRAILGVHTRSVPLAADVDLDALAATTTGMVGADLGNLVNEAALLAAHRDLPAVTMPVLLEALEKLVLGAERRILLSPAERRRTAYHEAGHALVAMLTPAADPVRKVSIVPRGEALGVTISGPDADRFSYDRAYLEARLRVALGGRVAEALACDEVSTGAEADLRELTAVARDMVTRWGMSDAVGPVVVDPGQAAQLYGLPSTVSPGLQHLVEEEVQRLATTAQADVEALLRTHRTALDALADALLREETLDHDAAWAAAGLGVPVPAGSVVPAAAPAPAAAPV
jgi:cell division protease FtsH